MSLFRFGAMLSAVLELARQAEGVDEPDPWDVSLTESMDVAYDGAPFVAGSVGGDPDLSTLDVAYQGAPFFFARIA